MADSLINKVHLVQPLFPSVTPPGGSILSAPPKFASAIKEATEKAHRAHFKVSKADANEALKAYNKVIADGKHLKEFNSDPVGTAKKLGIHLSHGAAEALQSAITFGGHGGGIASDAVELVCVAIIVLVLAMPVADFGEERVLVDTSGRITL